MRNNFHYGFGTRLTAVVLTMLMVLSLGGFVLRDTGMGVDEPMVFDESYGTPAPEATEVPAESTPAPEATEAPAEDTPVPADTPAPEATEMPAEATPIPETDSGTDTDTNTDTSEPETTADPQDTPAPEGDTPADEPMTIAGETASIEITVEPDAGTSGQAWTAGPRKYVMKVTARGADLVSGTTTDTKGLQIKNDINEDKVQFGDLGSTEPDPKPVFKENKVSSNEVRIGSVLSIDGSTATNGSIVITKDHSDTIEFTVTPDGTDVSGQKATVQFHVETDSGSAFAGFQEIPKTTIVTVDIAYVGGKDVVTVTNGIFHSDGTITSGSGNTTPGGDDDGGVHIIYHINDNENGGKESKDPYTQDPDEGTGKDAEGKYTFTLKNPEEIGFSNNNGILKIDNTDRYFAGWQLVEDPAGVTGAVPFNGYGSVTYPFTRNKIYADDGDNYSTGENYRHIPVVWSGSKIESRLKKTTDKTIHLYALWAKEGNSALLGYSMGLLGATLEDSSINLAQAGLGENTKFLKYVVHDTGHYDGNKIDVTNISPTKVDNNTFVAWYNKAYSYASNKDLYNAANTNNPFTFPGGQVIFGKTHDVFTLDAVWGRIDDAESRVPYDTAGHAPGGVELTFTGGNDPALSQGDITAAYTVTVTKGSASQTVDKRFTDGVELSLSAVNGGVVSITDLPRFTEVGEYIYTITVTFHDNNASDGCTKGGDTKLTGHATLIIDPVLRVKVTKTVTPEDKWTDQSFNVELSKGTDGESDNAALPPVTEATLTSSVKSHDFDYVSFPGPGTYDLIVQEIVTDRDPSMKYDDEPKTITVTVEDGKPYTMKGSGVGPEGGNIYTVTQPFTNAFATGALKITKIVEHEEAHNSDGFKDSNPFQFTVTTDPKIDGEFTIEGADEGQDVSGGKITFAEGVATFELTIDGYSDPKETYKDEVTIKDLPAGTECTVTEEADNRYATRISPISVEIQGGGEEEVTVTNQHYPGSLVIGKVVDDPYLHDEATVRNFSFTVTITNADSDVMNHKADPGDIYDVDFTDGVAHITLTNNTSKTIKHLPAGTEYTVQEVQGGSDITNAANLEDYETTVTGTGTESGDRLMSGTIGAGLNQVQFKNVYKTGNLTITKKVEGDAPSQEFEIKLKFDGPKWTGLSSLFTDARIKALNYVKDVTSDGTIVIGLRNGQTFRMPDLPAGLRYTVREADAAGFTTTYSDSGNGEIHYNGTSAVVVTNTYLSGDLAIKKNLVEGGNIYGRFTMQVELGTGYPLKSSYSATLSGTNTTARSINGDVPNITSVTFSGRRATFDLYKDETLTIQVCPRASPTP